MTSTLRLGTTVGSLFALLVLTEGCGSGLAQPFDQMKTADMTVYALQNTPDTTMTPAGQAQPAAPQGGLNDILQHGVDFLKGLGVQVPPNLIPGAPGVTPTPAAPQVPHFHEYPILAYKQVTDASTKEDIAKLFGTESNFNNAPGACFNPSLGFAIANPQGGPPAEIFVAEAPCNQVRAYNINWPFGSKVGLEAGTEKKLTDIVRKIFSG